MFTSPGEVALNIGQFNIHYYGICLAIAIVCGFGVLLSIAKFVFNETQETYERLIDMSFWVILGAIIGARLYYVLFNLNYYMQTPKEIFMVQNGGISIHGALIGGILVSIWWLKRKKLPVLKFFDYYAYALPIGQAIGRWGNFFNSEAYGSPTNFPWAVYIPYTKRLNGFQEFSYFHPTFLYESIWNLIVFFILFFIIRKIEPKAQGTIFFSYLALYSFGRIFIESIRIDSIQNFFYIPLASLVSLIFLVGSLLAIKFLNKKKVV